MPGEELKKLLARGESEIVEFKESFSREAIETAGAFANTKGGTVYIGVANKGLPVGIQVGPDILKDWANQIAQNSDPRVIPDTRASTVAGKSIVAVHIEESPIKPVSVKGKCYRRVGTSNRVMTPVEIAEMHLQSVGSSWDMLPAPNRMTGIDPEKVKGYIRRANTSGRRRIAEGEDHLRVLRKLGLVKDGRPTWAAILLFGKEPQRTLSQAVVHCGRFKQETLVIDDRMIGGTIVEQVEDAMRFIQKNINVKFVITGKPARDEIWDYPLEALREALVNAVCHRDYTIPSNTDVRIHDDRLEIWSPGGLPLGITIEDLFRPHPSVLRNKGIGAVLYDIGWIEKWGSGIDKIRTLCTKAELPEPSFEEQAQGFRAVFRKDILTPEYLENLGLSDRQIAAVRYVREHGSITNAKYQHLVGIKRRLATDELGDMVSKGVLERTGRVGKGVHYKLAMRGANGRNAH